MSFSIDKRRLPPINSLIAFEAAARLGSFALAGAEVHLTASAISRQVKALEEHLSVQLFERVRQRIVLTEAGRFLAGQVRQTLGRLLAVSDQAAQLRSYSRTLTIGILPAFANYWLIPRLPSFVQAHPDIQINLVGIGVGYDYESGGLDAAIHTNARLWTDSSAIRLGDEEMIAVAAPQWVESHHPTDPQDLVQHTLLELGVRPYLWAQWFEYNLVQVPPGTRLLKFGHYSMVFEAAMAGLGVALVPELLCRDLIASGRLVEVTGQGLAIGAGYFLVHPRHREDYLPLQQFRQWAGLQLEGAAPTVIPATPG